MLDGIDQKWRSILLVAVVLVVSTALSVMLRALLHFYIKNFSNKIKADPTNFSFLKNSASFIIYGAALIYVLSSIPEFHSLGTALFAGAGVFAAIIGLASQQAFSNIINGVFILIFRPFRVGDVIETSDKQKGVVEEITLRHTIIRDYDNRRLIVPNSIIGQEKIVNSDITDDFICQRIRFGISYDSDVDTAIRIIREEIAKHALLVDHRSAEDLAEGKPLVLVRVVAWADSSITLQAYAWVNGNDNGFALQCDVYYSIKKRFEQEGIEIPFPHRTIVMKTK